VLLMPANWSLAYPEGLNSSMTKIKSDPLGLLPGIPPTSLVTIKWIVL
jgi:hypothetical protein